MSVWMVGLGLIAESGLGATWLEVTEKFTGQVDLFAEEGTTGVKEGCL